ncbi:Hypothetical protein LBF_0899 [Leptospira biflexa serovar Patoc strain 'Patoc 1 (Ames)']|uniref:Uncharacterized protein n=1 Tax=Leptospira biflexa serovar Patoc (strain Patoc 1 / ATCC 23582 / Paris) TaxID=456481 RepID=B0SMB2_LEPBP|nr:hypothetical protein [Leptospira biflexa]ABZ93430.1 Hypothetical protein LBF_0899 [Leptospira biflexa serovar Patoc strain 'Patoc 1 (Ames)']ABZ97056.1 Conserved hypothetical protein; putative signal peptide [Leptospira biflexa serovar Patoc strain 'Patoc 1 (Paris)']
MKIQKIVSMPFQEWFSSVFLLFFLIHFLFHSLLYAETDSKYSGPISRTEKRILDGKLEYQKTGNFPLEWKLYFKAKQGDFVVFYDLNGDEIHFRYRRNKFDLDAEFFVKDLFVGNPYLVKGEWIGYYFYSIDERGKRSSLPTPKKLPGDKNEIVEKQTIPIFQLKEYAEIRTDDLLY